MFFIVVYIHMARGLYYGSYRAPRVMLWSVGVFIFLTMMGGFRSEKGNLEIEMLQFINLLCNKVSEIYTGIDEGSKESEESRWGDREGPNQEEDEDRKRRKRKLSKKEREKVTLKRNEMQVIIGSMLGDMSMNKRGTENAYFLYSQGGVHRSYIKFMYGKLERLTTGYGISEREVLLKGNRHISLYFYSIALPALNEIYEMFYQGGRKVVPKNIAKFMDFGILAIWIMDDGFRKGEGLRLCTDSFSKEDVELLIEALKEKLGINPTIIIGNRGKGQYRISINKRDMMRIRPHLRHYMHKKMYYKIGIKENELRRVGSERYVSNKERKEIMLTEKMTRVLVGLILGGMSIIKGRGEKVNPRLCYSKGRRDGEYMRHVYEILKDLTRTGIKVKSRAKIAGKEELMINSMALPCLNKLYEVFYKDKRKVIPLDIGNYLTEESLAYLLMEDGERIEGEIVIKVGKFKDEEVGRLEEVLKMNFGIESKKVITKYRRIVISGKEIDKLIEIVRPYMHRSRSNRIGLEID